MTPLPMPSGTTAGSVTEGRSWRARLGVEFRIIGSGALLPAVLLPMAGGLLVALLQAAGRPAGVVDSAVRRAQ